MNKDDRINKFETEYNENAQEIAKLAAGVDVVIPNIYTIYRNKMYAVEDNFRKHGIDFFNPEDKNADILFNLINDYLSSMARVSIATICIGYSELSKHKLRNILRPKKYLQLLFNNYINTCNIMESESINSLLKDALEYKFKDDLEIDNCYKEAFTKIGRESLIIEVCNDLNNQTSEYSDQIDFSKFEAESNRIFKRYKDKINKKKR